MPLTTEVRHAQSNLGHLVESSAALRIGADSLDPALSKCRPPLIEYAIKPDNTGAYFACSIPFKPSQGKTIDA
ncbi:MAG TPA: hypothetical protein DDY14_14045 [Chromatiaceae bacterium]|jgi:hypothetical protein|nr:MAG: hypothetical protein N838_15510 [Thiohalocapsa sp. PB-PSB1]HBG96401.1 hypothetical protein [Chromatiaceae bacterium]HCS92045.1 hypothetical protein [Chromatiaceae bacterium]